MSWRDCIDGIKRAAGVDFSDEEVERILSYIKDRAARSTSPGLSEADAFAKAAKELSEEAKAAAAIERRNAILNLEKRVARRAFYADAPASGRTPGPLVGLEAKLVGMNAPFAGGRLSVDAQRAALQRQYLGGLAIDLERAGLFEGFKSGALDREVARELAERAKPDGKPGISGSKEAERIAEIVRGYQVMAKDGLNRAGAWIGDYEGWIARTAHDPDRIRRAGYDAWREATLKGLDAARTFEGVEDPERFLKGVWQALVTGVHLTQDGAKGFKDPAFAGPGNLAKRLSQERVLHWRDADAWMDYQRDFGVGSFAETLTAGLRAAARDTALMREFGTNPRAELQGDIAWLRETRRDDTRLMLALNARERALWNRYDQLDGTASRPVDRHWAAIGAGTRAWISMSKLGGMMLSAISDIPLKAAELRYQGVGFLEAYADGFASILRGKGSGAWKETADLLRAGTEGMRNDIASRFDAADTAPGRLAKWQNVFFKWTGINYWTDAQRRGAEMVMARELGRRRGAAWDALAPETRRILTMFDIDEADWRALGQAEWRQADGRTYLTPDVAREVPDDAIDAAHGARVAEARAAAEKRGADPDAAAGRTRAELRDDLALKLHAYFADRAEYAVIAPGAKERALLTQGSLPGTPAGEAIRFVTQFKAFPVAVLSKAWGREIYGGQGTVGAIGGLAHLIAGSAVFGYLAMAAKDIAKGRSPRDPTDWKTMLAALAQGGGAGLYGDFVFGEWSRFGRSLGSSLAGPAVGTVDDAAAIWSGIVRGEDVKAETLRLAVNNAPFVNLFYTRAALDYLVLYQIQEAMNPGFLRRTERRLARENHQHFILPPSSVVNYGGPAALSPLKKEPKR